MLYFENGSNQWYGYGKIIDNCYPYVARRDLLREEKWKLINRFQYHFCLLSRLDARTKYVFISSRKYLDLLHEICMDIFPQQIIKSYSFKQQILGLSKSCPCAFIFYLHYHFEKCCHLKKTYHSMKRLNDMHIIISRMPFTVHILL